MNIAFVVGEFPSISKTFIIRQITGLIGQGHAVDIYATKPQKAVKLHAEVKQFDLLSRTYYLPPVSAQALRRLAKGLYTVLSQFSRAPKFHLGVMGNLLGGNLSVTSLMLAYTSMFCEVHRSYDIIHCHFLTYGLDGIAIRNLISPNAKVVVTFHGYDVHALDPRCAGEASKAIFREADLYTANTTFTAKKAEKLGCPAEKIEILPVGLEISKYPFSESDLLRKIESAKNGRVKILTVGRLVEKKGIEYAIKAFANLASLFPMLEYQIVGEGPLLNDLKALAEQLAVADRVVFRGAMTHADVRRLYRESHIFVLPSVTAKNSDMEGQALVLQEAQATGLPVISTLHNGIPDGVLDGESGFLVPERDVESLTNRLSYLLHNPDDWFSFGKAGRRFVINKYDIDKLNRALNQLYELVLNTEKSNTVSAHQTSTISQ